MAGVTSLNISAQKWEQTGADKSKLGYFIYWSTNKEKHNRVYRSKMDMFG